MTQNKRVQFSDWGITDYQEAWDKQEELFAKTVAIKQANRGNTVQQPAPNHLFVTAHRHVYTLGKSGHIECSLLDEEGLKAHQAAVYRINRGGDITYHGPAQIVAYPILDFDNFCADKHLYLR